MKRKKKAEIRRENEEEWIVTLAYSNISFGDMQKGDLWETWGISNSINVWQSTCNEDTPWSQWKSRTVLSLCWAVATLVVLFKWNWGEGSDKYGFLLVVTIAVSFSSITNGKSLPVISNSFPTQCLSRICLQFSHYFPLVLVYNPKPIH